MKVQKDKEDLEEVSNELELADEEEKVPYAMVPDLLPHLSILTSPTRYKVGDTFYSLPVPEVQELLSASTEKVEEAVTEIETKLGTIREEMEQLKVQLYARFGKSINLES